MTSLTEPAKAIVEVGRRIWSKGWVAANDGNMSVRLDETKVLITPTGASKGFLEVEDLISIDLTGRVLGGRGRPSSESLLHLSVYRDRPDVGGICHAHPVFATAYAVAGQGLTQKVLPEVVVALGEIPLVPYATPGGAEFYQPLKEFIPRANAFLLQNHGVLTLGKDVIEAYFRMETVEQFAKILFVATQLGHVNELDKQQVAKLEALRERLRAAAADLASE
ncbi:MAG TPA: class II aldolase/adducin family protein [Polyangia bacterium]|jgi:Ribulose-5-phosphate 4-epimerase and related epimerases and aldolases|nr:class II aldolase/adducin family protein [Polyangia bacterium]